MLIGFPYPNELTGSSYPSGSIMFETIRAELVEALPFDRF
jgi:hypothetical protein